MKKRVLKTSLIILIFITAIFAIYAFMKKETTSNISASQVKQLANNSNFPTSFTISQLNRFFVPYYGSYQIYCDNRSTKFLTQTAGWYRGNNYPITKLNNNITYTQKNEVEQISDVQRKKAAYIFSVNNTTGSYNSYKGFDDLSDKEKFGKFNEFPKSLVNWYIKQQAYWLIRGQGWGTWAELIRDDKTSLNWNAKWNDTNAHFETVNPTTDKNGKIVGNGDVVKEVNKLVNEAGMYYDYTWNENENKKKVQKLEFNNTKPTITVSNGVYTVKNLKVTHTGYKATDNNGTINFSGISGMYVQYYNKNGKQVGNDEEISKYTPQSGKEEDADYFTANDTEKIDRTNTTYPTSNEDFSISFKNPNKGKTPEAADWVTSIKIKITFTYMTASYEKQAYAGAYKGASAGVQPVYIVQPKRELETIEKTYDIKKITIDNGSYNIKLKKVEEDNETKLLSGVEFLIQKYNWSIKNEKWVLESSGYKTTGADGIIKIAENESITASNYNIPVWYHITESREKEGYKKYTGYIDVIVYKKLDTDNGKYAVNTIVVKDSGNTLTDGDNKSKPVKYTTTPSGETTTVTVSNPQVESGKFDLNLQKITAGTTSTKLHGAKFIIKDENNTSTEITEQKDENGGTGNYNLLKDQSIEKVGTYTYYITEKQAPTNPSACVKFTGKIKVEVKTGIGTITKNDKTTYKYIVTSINVKAFDSNNNELKENNSPVSQTNTTNGNKECTINLKMTNILEGSYDLKINKISSSSGEPLSGAKFKIQKATMNSSGTWTWDNGTTVSTEAKDENGKKIKRNICTKE